MATHTYTDKTISDTRALRAALLAAGEVTAIYTVIGDYVKIEASRITQAQCDAVIDAF